MLVSADGRTVISQLRSADESGLWSYDAAEEQRASERLAKEKWFG